jgi:hypothetical protein
MALGFIDYRLLSTQITSRDKSLDSHIWCHASSSYQQLRFISTFVTSTVFTLCRLLAKFLRSTKSPDYEISCHVPTHPTILVQWTTFDSGRVGPCVTPRSVHDRLVNRGCFLRTSAERDPEGSEYRWFTSLRKFEIRLFNVYLLAFPSDHAGSISMCA